MKSPSDQLRPKSGLHPAQRVSSRTFLASSLWERMENIGNLSVVVNDGNPLRAGISPLENDSPLIVNANKMISIQVPSEGLIHLYQFSQGNARNRVKTAVLFRIEQFFSVFVGKGLAHIEQTS